MAAGMAPPIAMALATVVRPGLFSKAERTAGEAGLAAGGVVHHRRGDSRSRLLPRSG